MKESFDQQTGQSPSPATGSRQLAQSCGSATPSAASKAFRTISEKRANRPVRGLSAVSSASMPNDIVPVRVA
jgi:hypothetical protein